MKARASGHLPTAREEFGRSVMGPILAFMLERLLLSLSAAADRHMQVVFFCSRGGLTMRRLLELFLARTDAAPPLPFEDFMVSRLSAARTAIQLNAGAAAPLVGRELAGRSCADAARALACVDVGADERWMDPFTVARFSELIRTTEAGRAVGGFCDEQADLLRRHVDALRGGANRIVLCDTGVFGSIGRYLQLGVPAVDWRMVLLYRANYKGLPATHFVSTAGAVSEHDRYVPWRPETVVLLYWPLIEALLEPDLPSVRHYRAEGPVRVVSNLEAEDWTSRLQPADGSMLAGAHDYLAELSPSSAPTIGEAARVAWRRLRHMVVYPTLADVALLAVGRRELDFGSDEAVDFGPATSDEPRTLWIRISTANGSIWPEGELKKQFPRSAGAALRCLETLRLLSALARQAGRVAGSDHAGPR